MANMTPSIEELGKDSLHDLVGAGGDAHRMQRSPSAALLRLGRGRRPCPYGGRQGQKVAA
ncbi:hypothetical protein [Actinomadura madurae]|uniref:hypothetical protein n=1 Tax=Actinomadura madurae TaxID=1993 RepID=UPI0020265947|nr:hypothetical protein [Actinomadura madurae]MCP9955693.1 hypothetical protein [Actinomadura madurae]MCP9972425.1 hypothetical protein [Actinomadura madurae]MCP9984938.1 hypothetical protein [Actinomadura madurae]MCQ0003504.1 hypothetical protein [Actinomadura madurae]MCQ0021133.1 hypothetical protein [Actinomadura madurae]